MPGLVSNILCTISPSTMASSLFSSRAFPNHQTWASSQMSQPYSKVVRLCPGADLFSRRWSLAQRCRLVKTGVREGNSGRATCAMETETKRNPAEELAGPDLENWQSSLSQVQALGFDSSEAETILGKAFGWINRKYWGDKKVDVVPSPDEVESVISYLKEIGVDGQNLSQVVKAFPHVLACSVEGRLKVNVRQLEREWSIKGASLVKSIVRKPIMLGYSVDCRGDCIAECDLCWARF